MLAIKDLFGKYSIAPKGRRVNQRQELIQYFTDKINKERENTKYPMVKWNYINFKLSHLKRLEDLYYLKSICDSEEKRGGSFSKVMFGAIK